MKQDQDSNAIIEKLLDERLHAVQNYAKADVLAYLGPISPPMDDEIKYAVEEIKDRRRKLMVVLETAGGYMETAERIAKILRHHYRQVEFMVPSFAMSAGTILVMSGDAIHMDYASTLGPVDPQVRRGDRAAFVPALGYLEMYERLIEKAKKGTLTTVEITYLIDKFDPAALYQYEQERDLSIALLTDWLVKFKFKQWRVTETQRTKVTNAMKTARAEAIARELNNTKRWHSHNRGITMDVLRRDLNLVIDDFGADAVLGPLVGEYFRLLKDYMGRRGHYDVGLHTHGTYQGI